jgi:hypothetical protein
MKIEDLDESGEVPATKYCHNCGQPFGDMWKHSQVCKRYKLDG